MPDKPKEELTKIEYWSYRVMRRSWAPIAGEKPAYSYGIYEVYFDQSDQVVTYSEESISPSGESIRELKGDVANYLKAFNSPILDYDNNGKELTDE